MLKKHKRLIINTIMLLGIICANNYAGYFACTNYDPHGKELLTIQFIKELSYSESEYKRTHRRYGTTEELAKFILDDENDSLIPGYSNIANKKRNNEVFDLFEWEVKLRNYENELISNYTIYAYPINEWKHRIRPLSINEQGLIQVYVRDRNDVMRWVNYSED